MPSPEQLRAYYLGEFERGAGLRETSMHATNVRVARQYIAEAERALGGFQWPGSSILDYGAGEGDLSLVLSQLGVRVAAFEPFGYEACQRRGIQTVRALKELSASAPFDGTFITEVLEHVEDPVRVLRQVGALLGPTGWIFVTTPNCESLRARLMRGRWGDRLKFGHLCLFSRAALTFALQAAGFRVTPCRKPIRFSDDPARRLIQFTLQACGLGGGLRALGTKRPETEGVV